LMDIGKYGFSPNRFMPINFSKAKV
jgi:hypothetical protein